MKDNWYEIVETLQPCIANNTIESEYQKKIEGCLKILGWKSSNKTMQSQIDIRIGNNNSIRPDIVLYKNNIPVLPIEIKRPTNICCEKQQQQLTSYMRQLKLNVGLYIGENIQLYYDTPDNRDSSQSIFKVELRKDDAKGVDLCEMLTYELFDIEYLNDFCEERYNQIIAQNKLEQRFDDFFSEINVERNIRSLLIDSFIKEGFDKTIVEGKLQKLTIQVGWSDVKKTLPKPIVYKEKRVEIEVESKDNVKEEFSIDGIHYFTEISRFVLMVVNQYISEHPNITIEELEDKFPATLIGNKKRGFIRTLDFVRENNYEDRFFTKSNDLIRLKDSTIVAVCNQWGNSGTQQNFKRFLEHIKKIYPLYTK